MSVRAMVPTELLQASDRLHTVDGVKNAAPELYNFDKEWFHSKDRIVSNQNCTNGKYTKLLIVISNFDL